MELSGKFEDLNISLTLADPRQEDAPLVYVNRAFETLTGYKREDVLGRNCRFLQRGREHQKVLAPLRKAISNLTSIDRCLINFKADGSEFKNYLVMHTVYDQENRPFICGCQYEVLIRPMKSDMARHLGSLDEAFSEIDTLFGRTNRVLLSSLSIRSGSAVKMIQSALDESRSRTA